MSARQPGPDTAEAALAVLTRLADPWVLAAVAAAPGGQWQPDPSVPQVWGWFASGKARVVVWLDPEAETFTCDDEWLRAAL